MKMPTEGFKVMLLSKNRKLKEKQEIYLISSSMFLVSIHDSVYFLNPFRVTSIYWNLYQLS